MQVTKIKNKNKHKDKRYSDQIREAINASYPRTKEQMAKSRNKTSLSAAPAPAKILRQLMLKGHIGQMGERTLMRPFRVRRHLHVNAYAAQVSTVGGGFAYNLQLDQLPGFADFTALFDQYRFSKFKYILIPRINQNSLAVAAVTTTSAIPTMITASDPDDSTAPTSVTELLEYEKVTVSRMEDVRGSFKPRAAIAAYGGAFTQFADFDGWIDCASDDVEWYALKNWVTAGGAAQTTFQVWEAYFSIDCEFRFVH